MQLYTYINPFVKKNVPANIFRIGAINTQKKTVTFKSVEYYINDDDALIEQSRDANQVIEYLEDTILVYYRGTDTANCRIEVLRDSIAYIGSDKSVSNSRYYINANRNYSNDISVVYSLSGLTNYLNEV